MSNDYDYDYDVIIIGSGAGGGTLALKLAPSGKRILILERGDYLPREKQNWDVNEVFVRNRYVSSDIWHDRDDKPFQPGVHYFVGGATKMYGAALFRLREHDFTAHRTADGLTPDWPLGYADFEPYYTQAEQLYQVHGQRGDDPTDPPASAPYPYPPVSHEPRIAEIADGLRRAGRITSRMRRARSCSTRPTGRTAAASVVIPAMATPAWCTPRPTPKSSPFVLPCNMRT